MGITLSLEFGNEHVGGGPALGGLLTVIGDLAPVVDVGSGPSTAGT